MTGKIFCAVFTISLFMIQCSNGSKSVASSNKSKIAIVKFQHETCTFCPGGDTEKEDWIKQSEPLNGNALLKSGPYIRGFVHQAEEYPDIELIGITSPIGVFGGSSRSWNSEASFDYFMETILKEIKDIPTIEGVYLALHGAMATRNIPRPEAEIAKRIRAVVGPDVPIVGTFDLHGNEDEAFLEWADGAFVTKRYPHYDAFLQGERAARYLRRCMQGDYEPTTASRKPAILTPTVVQWTGQSPSMDIMERARRWESREKDAFVSVFYGYPWSDVPDIGVCVHVMTNGDQSLADEIADDMNEYIWRVRKEFVDRGYLMPEEAISRTKMAITNKATPVALGDYSDRPGDATWILHQLLDQKVNNFLYASLRDERVLEKLQSSNAKIGDSFDMEVGGFTGEQAGKPVRLQGTIKFVGAHAGFDYIAAVELPGNNVVLIVPTYHQVTTLKPLTFGTIKPDDYEVFVVKSRVHFRRGFDETGYAKTIYVVDAPGPWFGTTRLDALDYKFGPIDKLYPYGLKG